MSGEIFKDLTGREVPATIEEIDRAVCEAAGLSKLPIVRAKGIRVADCQEKIDRFERETS